MYHPWTLYLTGTVLLTSSMVRSQKPNDPGHCFSFGIGHDGELPGKDIQFALENVTCPLTTGYTALSTGMNISSVSDSCEDILIALRGSSEYLNITTPMTSATSGLAYWQGGPILGIEFGVRQWVSQLVTYRQQLFDDGFGSSLPDQLMQQKEGMKTFITVVLSKIYEAARQDAEDSLVPVYGYFDCASQAFATSDSSITECPQTSGTSNSMPSTTKVSVTTAPSASSPTTSASTPSPTGAGSRIDSVAISVVLVVVSIGIAYGSGVI